MRGCRGWTKIMSSFCDRASECARPSVREIFERTRSAPALAEQNGYGFLVLPLLLHDRRRHRLVSSTPSLDEELPRELRDDSNVSRCTVRKEG